jgi:hypothetical protein
MSVELANVCTSREMCMLKTLSLCVPTRKVESYHSRLRMRCFCLTIDCNEGVNVIKQIEAVKPGLRSLLFCVSYVNCFTREWGQSTQVFKDS